MKSQLLLAAGQPLSVVVPRPVAIEGHAIECRINAEDPETFAPSAGLLAKFAPPGGLGIRVESAAYGGWRVPPYYDSLVAKVIAHAPNRELAIQRMKRALTMSAVEGIKTSIPLHLRILDSPQFVSGRYDTHFIEDWGL